MNRSRSIRRSRRSRVMRGGMCPPCVAAGIGVGKYMIGAAGIAGATYVSRNKNKRRRKTMRRTTMRGGSQTKRKSKLHGIVLELFEKDKKHKLSKIHYGKKALEKYVEISFKERDEKEKKKYMKNWDKTKLPNSVYFVHKTKRGLSHRFISNAFKTGGHSYLGHLERKGGGSQKGRKYPFAKGHLFFLKKNSKGMRITPLIVKKYPKAFSGKEYKHLINRYL